VLFEPFPDDFFWGATLPAHCVDGGAFHSDWWRWEQRPGHVDDNSVSDPAADHLHTWQADYKLAADFGLNMLEFSIDWSQVQPDPGHWDNEAIERYCQKAERMKELNIEPLGVLFHHASPLWFSEGYGWHHRDAVRKFLDFVERMIHALGDQVRYWVPIREPMLYSKMAYLRGFWPPGHMNPFSSRRAFAQLMEASKQCYAFIHKKIDDARVGASLLARHVEPADPHSAWDTRAALNVSRRSTTVEFDALSRHMDFIALGYYGREQIQFEWHKPLKMFLESVDENGKLCRPLQTKPDVKAFSSILDQITSLKLPVLFLGNGLGTGDDVARGKFILEHLNSIRRSVPENLLMGYLYHGMLDGFEWHDGLSKRYGLFHVDYASQRRTPNSSAFLMEELSKSGTIPDGTLSRLYPKTNLTAQLDLGS
jgi:beta-glucosidase